MKLVIFVAACYKLVITSDRLIGQHEGGVAIKGEMERVFVCTCNAALDNKSANSSTNRKHIGSGDASSSSTIGIK